jgi:hypothetical protein
LVANNDLIGSFPRAQESDAVLQRRAFSGAESVADESEHGLGDIEIRIIDRTLEIQTGRDPVLALVRNQPHQSHGHPGFEARKKTAVRGRLQLEMVEYRLCVSPYVTICCRRLDIQGRDATSNIDLRGF